MCKISQVICWSFDLMCILKTNQISDHFSGFMCFCWHMSFTRFWRPKVCTLGFWFNFHTMWYCIGVQQPHIETIQSRQRNFFCHWTKSFFFLFFSRFSIMSWINLLFTVNRSFVSRHLVIQRKMFELPSKGFSFQDSFQCKQALGVLIKLISETKKFHCDYVWI